MDSQKNRIVEPGLYQVVHNEGTHLVESRRVEGELHSMAYADSGNPVENDAVTLRAVSLELYRREVGMRQVATGIAVHGANQIVDYVAYFVARSVVEYGTYALRQFAPFAWGKLRAFGGDVYARLRCVGVANARVRDQRPAWRSKKGLMKPAGPTPLIPSPGLSKGGVSMHASTALLCAFKSDSVSVSGKNPDVIAVPVE